MVKWALQLSLEFLEMAEFLEMPANNMFGINSVYDRGVRRGCMGTRHNKEVLVKI